MDKWRIVGYQMLCKVRFKKNQCGLRRWCWGAWFVDLLITYTCEYSKVFFSLFYSVPSCSIETLMLSLSEYFVDLRNITDEFVPIDSEVILECKESASLMGNPRVTCGSSGEWEVGEVMCKYSAFKIEIGK